MEKEIPPPNGWGALEKYLLAAGLTAFLLVFVPLEIAYWPWPNFLLLSIAMVVVVGKGKMVYDHHLLDLAHRRNKLIVIHDTDQGFGYLTESGVQGYSHTMQGLPPFDPGIAGLLGEGPEKNSYPKTFRELLKSGYVAPGADFVPAFDPE